MTMIAVSLQVIASNHNSATLVCGIGGGGDRKGRSEMMKWDKRGREGLG
jgi:hypothetical protein